MLWEYNDGADDSSPWLSEGVQMSTIYAIDIYCSCDGGKIL